jgi:hypothetical protein
MRAALRTLPMHAPGDGEGPVGLSGAGRVAYELMREKVESFGCQGGGSSDRYR